MSGWNKLKEKTYGAVSKKKWEPGFHRTPDGKAIYAYFTNEKSYCVPLTPTVDIFKSFKTHEITGCILRGVDTDDLTR